MEPGLIQSDDPRTPCRSPVPNEGNSTSNYETPITQRPRSRSVHYQHSSRKKKQPRFGLYTLGQTLGEGEFGKVKLGYINNDNIDTLNSSGSKLGNYSHMPKQVAIKLIRRDTLSASKESEIKLYREINALKMLTHPNIVKLEEVLQNSKYIGIVLEYASGGEFYKYIKFKKRLKESKACTIFAQLISGVSYIHSKGLVHRDLKLENLLLDKAGNLLITDFGFVNEVTKTNKLMHTPCGSPCYAAPELVTSVEPYNARKADIWSCGVILYAMLAGYLPWDDDPKNINGTDIVKLYKYIENQPLKFPEYINMVPRDLLRRMLEIDPAKRMSMKHILQHAWITPHQVFLSVTTEEWDRSFIVKKSNPSTPSSDRTAPTQNRLSRYTCSNNNSSMSIRNHRAPRPHSTTFLDIKRDSLIIDSTLFNMPLPPKESQFNATSNSSKTSLSSNTSVPTTTCSAISSSGNASSNKHSHHTRTNSAASIALQAVVNSDRENHILKDITNTIHDTGTVQNSKKTARKYRPMSYHPDMSTLTEYSKHYLADKIYAQREDSIDEEAQTTESTNNTEDIENTNPKISTVMEYPTRPLNNRQNTSRTPLTHHGGTDAGRSTTKKLFDFIKRRSIRI
ncbi:hypothetical protein TPHA_0D01140 [Tetrapisispora phaffii CBS 4417]|uniref:non-specific serine/threonine protein kinase n=1 Tax=Tetrapisispora phaffii (strain ATCC 24235 / CBS 4417 / NBRC 1672 / NRRL Y-8282 / UCD 70-5) TaxID=1071381 RepID=G8BSD4_TETPH|nr:hypothetical protein TPHA_0D01140 [Tetrapisispora phaffii CBS 4417]CCE62755.1 hypothetical protein TPHA_0D01140 [Tetrapisispora phaffii CBS 4417]